MIADALIDALPAHHLQRDMRERPYKAHESIFRQGDPTRFLHILRSGRVSLARVLQDGTLVTIHVAEPGETFAEAALFSETHHCDCIADEPSTVAVLPKEALLALMAADAAFATAFVRLLSRQVHDLRNRLAFRNIKSARDRVLTWLALAAKDGVVSPGRPLKAIASEIGLAPEVLYRTLASLEASGSVRRVDGRIELRLA